MSLDEGTKCIDLSNDHKPCAQQEKIRILKAGGKIYKTQVHTISMDNTDLDDDTTDELIDAVNP